MSSRGRDGMQMLSDNQDSAGSIKNPTVIFLKLLTHNKGPPVLSLAKAV